MSFNGPLADICDNNHSLLEPPSPAYTNVTVRRAFIVWMYCGQRNKFKDVCNYFHHLEALEDQLSPERRALSRHHEFNLFSNQPPVSSYLIDNFPHLYKETYIDRHNILKVEETRSQKCVFNLDGFNEIAPRHGTTTHEIVEASRMIRKFCRIQMISLEKFLEEFKQHAKKCALKFTVNNVAFYIKRKMIQAEIELEANYPKTLGFLNSTSAENLFDDIQDASIKSQCLSKGCKSVSCCKKIDPDDNVKPIKILRKGAENMDNLTKNYYSNSNNGFNNHSINGDKGIKDDNSTDYDKTESMLTIHVKSVSIEDLSDDNVAIKKERRFSGSRFMKIESDKIRKI